MKSKAILMMQKWFKNGPASQSSKVLAQLAAAALALEAHPCIKELIRAKLKTRY